MAPACVVGTIGRHCADLFAFGDLVEQFRQDRTVTIATGSEFHGADVRRGGIHGQMHLAPLECALNTILAGLPFAIAQKLATGADNEQVQRPVGAPIGDQDGQALLTAAQGRAIWHGPVQARQLQQAGHHSGRLPQRQLEQGLDGQAELDRRIRKDRRTTGLDATRSFPGHVLVQPDGVVAQVGPGA